MNFNYLKKMSKLIEYLLILIYSHKFLMILIVWYNQLMKIFKYYKIYLKK